MYQKVKCRHDRYNSLVIALLLLSVTVKGQQVTDQTLILRNLFEEALLNSSESLYRLQQVYFNPSSTRSPVSICLIVDVTVDNIVKEFNPDNCPFSELKNSPAFTCDNGSSFALEDTTNCKKWSFSARYELKLANDESDPSQLSELLTSSDSRVFYLFDPSFYNTMKALSTSIELSFHAGYYDTIDNQANIEIHISEDLEKMPCWNEVVYALSMLLVWAKAYARANGLPNIKLEMDRSLVDSPKTRKYDYYSCPNKDSISSSLVDPQNTGVLFQCIFLSSNLLLLSSVILYVRKIFHWLQKQGKHTKTLYKASAIVLTCVNIIVLILDLTFVIRDAAYMGLHNSDTEYFDFALVLYFKVPLVIFILILETPVICFNTHGVNGNNILNKKRYRIAHAFAFCQIIWFSHRLVTDAIISIVFFIIAPAQTLGVVTLLLSVIGSAIVFVAITLNKGFNGCNKKMCTFLFCASFNGIIICGLLFVITLLFIVFVDNGLKSAGMGGLILSLVPPFIVFVIGLIVNQKYFRSTTGTASVNTITEPQEIHQEIAIQVDDDEDPEVSQQPLLPRLHHPNQL